MLYFFIYFFLCFVNFVFRIYHIFYVLYLEISVFGYSVSCIISIFTESAHWADSVRYSQCPSVCCPLPVKFISRPLIGPHVTWPDTRPLIGPPFHNPWEGPPMWHVSCVTCHMSHVTCHVSHVTCLVSQFFFNFFFLKGGEISRWRDCHQRGLPDLVSI